MSTNLDVEGQLHHARWTALLYLERAGECRTVHHMRDDFGTVVDCECLPSLLGSLKSEGLIDSHETPLTRHWFITPKGASYVNTN